MCEATDCRRSNWCSLFLFLGSRWDMLRTLWSPYFVSSATLRLKVLVKWNIFSKRAKVKTSASAVLWVQQQTHTKSRGWTVILHVMLKSSCYCLTLLLLLLILFCSVLFRHRQIFLSGCLAGVFTTVIVAPGERIKCLLQVKCVCVCVCVSTTVSEGMVHK